MTYHLPTKMFFWTEEKGGGIYVYNYFSLSLSLSVAVLICTG
jgi:hypothetical protein